MEILDLISNVAEKAKPIIEIFILIWGAGRAIIKMSPIVLSFPMAVNT